MDRFRHALSNRAAVIAITAAVAVVVAVGGFALAGGLSNSNAPSAADATVTVTGTGQASGAPDTMTLQMSVSVTASSATKALDSNSAKMLALQKVLLRAGVARSDLQTSDLEVSPNYNENGDVSGYGAVDGLTVTFHRISDSGRVIDAAAHAVGNDVQISGISFSISDESSLLQAARSQAMSDARRDAEQLARGAGTTLGPVEKISDQGQQSTPVPVESFAAAAGRTAVPVQSGTEQLSVQVQAVYSLGG